MPITSAELHLENQPDVEQMLCCPCGSSYLRHAEVKRLPGVGIGIVFVCDVGCEPELVLRNHKGEVSIRWRWTP